MIVLIVAFVDLLNKLVSGHFLSGLVIPESNVPTRGGFFCNGHTFHKKSFLSAVRILLYHTETQHMFLQDIVSPRRENVNMKYGELIRKERKKQKKTQEELAKEIGVTARTIEFWERGERNMTLTNADKVFKALGVSITIGKEGGEEKNEYCL